MYYIDIKPLQLKSRCGSWHGFYFCNKLL